MAIDIPRYTPFVCRDATHAVRLPSAVHCLALPHPSCPSSTPNGVCIGNAVLRHHLRAAILHVQTAKNRKVALSRRRPEERMLHLAVRSLVTVMFSTMSQLLRSDDFVLCASLIQVCGLISAWRRAGRRCLSLVASFVFFQLLVSACACDMLTSPLVPMLASCCGF